MPVYLLILTATSCFPIVPKIACDHLGLPIVNPPKPFTLLGGLTSFGGAGNNYSMHVSQFVPARHLPLCGTVTHDHHHRLLQRWHGNYEARSRVLAWFWPTEACSATSTLCVSRRSRGETGDPTRAAILRRPTRARPQFHPARSTLTALQQ